jgi:hypothetical protein
MHFGSVMAEYMRECYWAVVECIEEHYQTVVDHMEEHYQTAVDHMEEHYQTAIDHMEEHYQTAIDHMEHWHTDSVLVHRADHCQVQMTGYSSYMEQDYHRMVEMTRQLVPGDHSSHLNHQVTTEMPR